MGKRVSFRLVYAPEVQTHLDAVESKHHGAIRNAIAGQLTHSPGKRTRNRKPLRPPAPLEATWELRCGPGNRFRVFYEIDEGRRAVNILGIGVKDRNRLMIGKEEIRT